MKKIFAAMLFCAVLTLSGCYGNNNPSGTEREKNVTMAGETEVTTTAEETTTAESTTTAEVTTTTTVTSASITTTAEDDLPVLDDTIIGMDGTVIDRPVEQIGKLGATFDTLTFYRESTGQIFNDDSYHDLKSEWKKAVLGDNFGSLTVSSVSAVYDPIYGQNTEDHSLGEYYAWSRRVMSLDGTVTLRGVLYADADEQRFWGKRLFFQPTAKSLAENNFPTLIPISCCFSSDPYYRTDTYEDTQYFYLGNIDDFADAIDWSLYTDENNIIEVYAEVELTGIKISYNTGTGASNEGEVQATKIIRVISD